MHHDSPDVSCAYIGLGHMGRPVFDAIHRYFVANGWQVTAVDRDPVKFAGLTVEAVAA